MAENKTNFVITPIKNYIKFNNNDRSKNKKFSISLFQKTLNFKLYSAKEDGKMKDKPDVDVYFQHLAYNEELLVLACEEILRRIKLMSQGKEVESNPIIFHNSGGEIKQATNFISFDAYTKDDKQVVVIQLKKKNSKDDDEWKEKGNFYLSSGSVPRVFVKDGIQFKEHYTYFKSLYDIMTSYSSRTSIKRDEHWKKVAEMEAKDNGNSNGNSSYNNNTSKAHSASQEVDEDDDDIF